MAEAGIVKHWEGDVGSTCAAAVKKLGSGLRVCDIGLNWTDDVQGEGTNANHYNSQIHNCWHDENSKDKTVGAVFVTIGQRSTFVVRGLADLNAKHPGLGPTILDALWKGFDGLGLHDLHSAFSLVSYNWWQGEHDESSVLAEARENDPDAQIYTRAEWDKTIPKWAWMWKKNEVLSDAQLRKIKHPAVPLITQCRRDAMKIRGLPHRLRYVDYASELAYPCFLRWSEEDPIEHAVDEYADLESQSGENYTDLAWVRFFASGDMAAMRAAFRDVERVIKAAASAERLLTETCLKI